MKWVTYLGILQYAVDACILKLFMLLFMLLIVSTSINQKNLQFPTHTVKYYFGDV
jgi:hypothetical protein